LIVNSSANISDKLEFAASGEDDYEIFEASGEDDYNIQVEPATSHHEEYEIDDEEKDGEKVPAVSILDERTQSEIKEDKDGEKMPAVSTLDEMIMERLLKAFEQLDLFIPSIRHELREMKIRVAHILAGTDCAILPKTLHTMLADGNSYDDQKPAVKPDENLSFLSTGIIFLLSLVVSTAVTILSSLCTIYCLRKKASKSFKEAFHKLLEDDETDKVAPVGENLEAEGGPQAEEETEM